MQRPRTPSKLSESLHQRLNSYALAASAAGVGLLALAPTAEAKIIYTKTHIVIGKRLPLNLDHRHHDGHHDFTFSHFSYTHRGTTTGSWSTLRQLRIIPEEANGVMSHAAALEAGVRIEPHNKFQNRTQIMVAWGRKCSRTESSTCHSGSSGNWKDVTNRYLGLKFFVAGKVHYGWARLNVSGLTATLTGYAYETIPNKPIIAGKTKGPDVVTIEVGKTKGPDVVTVTSGRSVITLQNPSLGHLARGASAIPSWRAKESK